MSFDVQFLWLNGLDLPIQAEQCLARSGTPKPLHIRESKPGHDLLLNDNHPP